MRLFLLFFMLGLPLSAALVECKLISYKVDSTHFDCQLTAIHKEGFHTYWKTPGAVGQATTFSWQGLGAATLQETVWPPAETLKDSYVVSGEARFLFHFAGALPEKLVLEATWLACSNETCIPVTTTTEATIVESAPVFDSPSDFLWSWFFFAFLGGLILNLMPCVLPVISLKVLGFAHQAQGSRKDALLHGLSFTAGVLVFFWGLGALLLGLRAAGHEIGWGFQLQNPLFVAILTWLLFVFGLSLLGVFEIGTGLLALGGGRLGGFFGSFLSGCLAVLVATPCVGPFLGVALGLTLTVSWWVAMLLYTAIGLGLAFPYLLASLFPAVLRVFPKPGAWMLVFKAIMGYLVVLTALWLFYVFMSLVQQPAASFLLLLALLLSAAAASLYSFGADLSAKKVRRWLCYGLSLALVLGSFALIARSTNAANFEDKNWKAFTPALIAQLEAEDKPYFIDFTAAWCVTCQVNHPTSHSNAVEKAFLDAGFTLIEADWTRYDADITKTLASYGRNGVPLYVLKPKGKPAVILPQILTEKILLDALHDAL